MKNINEEYEKFEDSILYMSGLEEREARLVFSKKLMALIEQHPNAPDLYHKLGLCLYNLASWETEDKKTIEISFHRALLLDEDSVFSRVFLVHFYFDIDEFDLSLKLYGSINPDLQKNIPVWRLVKLHQIKLSCMVYLNMLTQEGLGKELLRLLSKYDELDEDDSIAAVPSELRKALVSNSSVYSLITLKEPFGKVQELCELAE